MRFPFATALMLLFVGVASPVLAHESSPTMTHPSGPVVDARIADVIADPQRYDGQTVRFRGQIDACYGWVCSVCPEDMTPATADQEKCLRTSFQGFADERDGDDPNGPPFSTAVWREMEKAFRFSVVTAEGVFDASCLPSPPSRLEDGAEIGELVVCTDRATTWRDVEVRQVHRRLPSNDGLLLDSSREGALKAVSPAIAASAEGAYREYVLTFDRSPDWKPIAVFQTEFPVLDEPHREAWACVCRIDDCSDAWPKREISLWARTVNDPYFCYFALERQGVWRIYPE